MSSRRDELACIGSDLLQASRHIPRQRHPLLCYNNACVCCSCKNLLIHLKGLRVHTNSLAPFVFSDSKEGDYELARQGLL